MKKKHILSLCVLAALGNTAGARIHELKSPDGRNVVQVEADGDVHYSLARDGQPILTRCRLTLTVDGDTWGAGAKCRSARRNTVGQKVDFPVARRARTMTDEHNELVLAYGKYTIEFRAFNGTLHAGEVKSYIQLCLAISHQALTTKAASPTRPDTDNPKYTFRCWLLRLGFIGDEFETARLHLTKRLPGNAAWRQAS